jgi:hypothetical protein
MKEEEEICCWEGYWFCDKAFGSLGYIQVELGREGLTFGAGGSRKTPTYFDHPVLVYLADGVCMKWEDLLLSMWIRCAKIVWEEREAMGLQSTKPRVDLCAEGLVQVQESMDSLVWNDTHDLKTGRCGVSFVVVYSCIKADNCLALLLTVHN